MELTVDSTGAFRILTLLARTCPTDQYLREFIKNAVEANERGQEGDRLINSSVSIARDKQYPSKIVIANSQPGDPFTKDIVKQNLLTLGKTGHDENLNHGIGSKVSYLPNNEEGILFRSRFLGLQWEMCVMNGSICLRPYEIADEDGNIQQHIYTDCSDEEFTFPDSETEVVLLGANEDEDTWLKAIKDVGKSNNGSAAGYAICDYANRKFWTVPEGIEIKVHIDDDESTVRNARGLKYHKEKQKVNGVVDLSNGMRVHFYALNAKTSHIPSGTVAILHQNEILFEKERTASASRKLMYEAGVHTMHKDVMIIIEVPDGLGWKQSIERGSLAKDGESFTSNLTNYLEEFRGKFPQSLKDWMEENTPNHDASDIETIAKSVVGKLRSKLSITKNKTKSTKGTSTGQGPNASGKSATNGSDSSNSAPSPKAPPKRKKRKPQNQMGQDRGPGDVPKFKMIEDDEDDPMILWDNTNYICSINSSNTMFKNLLTTVCSGESYPHKIAEISVAEDVYLAAVKYFAYACEAYPRKSEDMLQSKLEEDKLESGAVLAIQGDIAYSRRRIVNRLRKGSV